jgi:hypothetical protein
MNIPYDIKKTKNKHMKSIRFLFTALVIFTATMAEAQLTIPAPSPNQTIEQQFATSKVELNYSRPGVKGRKIFGDLVPFDKVWRTGANGATTIYFGEEVKINNVMLAKGKYGILTIPGKKEWVIIISKDTTVTSPEDYKKENDVVRISVKPAALPKVVETFTIEVSDIKANECQVQIKWEKTQVSFNVSADIDKKIMAQIDEAMKGEKKPYYQAARYYFENDKDMNKALEWVKEAAKANVDAFWITHLQAKIELKLKKYDEAIATATASKEKAQQQTNADYVKLNEKVIAEAEKLK